MTEIKIHGYYPGVVVRLLKFTPSITMSTGDLMFLLKPRWVENFRFLSANLMKTGTASGQQPPMENLQALLPSTDMLR